MSKDDENNNEASEVLGEEGRRKLLKKLSAGGSGLAVAAWTAPIVTAVSIPAHAQTSTGGTTFTI